MDIEFITQMLQLSYGHLHPTLRQRGTLPTLRELRDRELIDQEDNGLLSDGYRFLRQFDHRLRLKHDQTIDLLEREAGKLQGIALAMGYRSDTKNSAGEFLLEDYENRREQIRSCYDRFFKTTSSESD